jgi:hypothetical protein
MEDRPVAAKDQEQHAPKQSVTTELSAATASKGTVHEQFIKRASTDPRFREVKGSGQGFVIVGAKPLK